MKKINYNGFFEASAICYGCMNLRNLDKKKTEEILLTALDEGIDYFDHADIYGAGLSEELFSNLWQLRPGIRDKIKVQTKCGIRQGYYDFSKEHILESVDNSLKRLKTDYLDTLLLHRPDTLMEPDEVNEAFNILFEKGKVRYFGVSNFSPMQIELLKTKVKYPLIANQLQVSAAFTHMFNFGINVNTENNEGINRDGSVLEYSRINNMIIQAWSPMQYGCFQGIFLNSEKYPQLNSVLERIANENNVSKAAVSFAFLLRHPAKIQPIAGTTNPNHLKDICQGAKIDLTRKEWYEIYTSAGNILP